MALGGVLAISDRRYRIYDRKSKMPEDQILEVKATEVESELPLKGQTV